MRLNIRCIVAYVRTSLFRAHHQQTTWPKWWNSDWQLFSFSVLSLALLLFDHQQWHWEDELLGWILSRQMEKKRLLPEFKGQEACPLGRNPIPRPMQDSRTGDLIFATPFRQNRRYLQSCCKNRLAIVAFQLNSEPYLPEPCVRHCRPLGWLCERT